MWISSLAIYPVKGLRGLALDRATVERQGLAGDRRWAVLRPDGRVWTQRDLPGMARVDAVPQGDGLRLEAAGFGGVDARVETRPGTAVVWGTPVPVLLANPAASDWLARVLGQACTLVHQADPASRPVTPDLAEPGDVTSLSDGFPLLVTTTASLAAVNARLDSPVGMERFRPNLVLDGAPAAWDEDGWARLDGATVRLRLASPCARCTVTTLDQRTGAATARKEPLRTLGQLHRTEAGLVTFGMNAIPERPGEVAAGDDITVGLRR